MFSQSFYPQLRWKRRLYCLTLFICLFVGAGYSAPPSEHVSTVHGEIPRNARGGILVVTVELSRSEQAVNLNYISYVDGGYFAIQQWLKDLFDGYNRVHH